jgi:hypothetical protein
MTYIAAPLSLRRLSALLLVLLGLVAPAARVSAQTGDQVLTTKYFTIHYPAGEEKTASWYASFADDVDVAVTQLLRAQPIEGITLRIYATEAEYGRANPMAEIHPGILAHVLPEIKEIGVAVERLRQAPPDLARESFRHEMTHVVAGELSGQNLPIGFQEGFAQYNELSSSRGHDVAQALQMAQDAGEPLLSLHDLNDLDTFRRNLDLAYPQSYALVAFLADHYGMAPFATFLTSLRTGLDLDTSLQTGYLKSGDDLDKEFREYLPAFLKEGWQTNILQANDINAGIALYEAGRFTEARDQFARSEHLFKDLGRTTDSEEAASHRLQAESAVKAADLAAQARQSLEKHDYAAAERYAVQAGEAFSNLSLDQYRQHAETTAQLARQGSEAMRLLQSAQAHKVSFNIPQAQAEAEQAGQLFAQLGDAPRVGDANALLSGLWLWQRLVGLVALGTGAICLLAGALAALRIRRRAPTLPNAVQQLREENRSWL